MPWFSWPISAQKFPKPTTLSVCVVSSLIKESVFLSDPVRQPSVTDFVTTSIGTVLYNVHSLGTVTLGKHDLGHYDRNA